MAEPLDIATLWQAELFGFVPLWGFLAGLAIALIAGFIKGAVGFAMPLVILSGLSLYLEPAEAIAGLIVPTVVSNLVQAFRYGLGQVWDVVREFRRYLMIVCVVILISAQFVTRVAPETFYLILGIPIVILSIIQLLGVRVRVPDKNRVAADWSVGLIAGSLGGFAGTWGPPTVIYLMAIGTPKAKSMLAQGIIYGLGSISLVAGHVQSGVINWTTLPFSACLLVPALIGQRIGLRMSDRLDPEIFRRLTLVVLLIAGLNLLRRAIF
ncbi:MAG: sulfite exporter TauE/SafE family protein [Pseudomonadota bacterium]